MTELLGVDYSATGSDDWDALAAAIVTRCGVGAPVGRYVVRDKSPGGRGISDAEYDALIRAKLQPYFFYEGAAEWMLGGYDAGVAAAQTSVSQAPANAPKDAIVRFAHDIEPQREHLPLIDACLRGAASVIGWERVGAYGGWALINYLAGGGTVKALCQTSAWQWDFGDYPNDRGIHPAAQLYQFAYNQWIGGANCDLTKALVTDFGQAVPHPVAPVPIPSVYAHPDLPDWWATALKQLHPSDATVDGVRWHAIRRNVEAVANTYRYSKPDIKSPKAGPPVKTRDRISIERWFTVDGTDAKGKPKKIAWLVASDGCYLAASRFSPRIAITPR